MTKYLDPIAPDSRLALARHRCFIATITTCVIIAILTLAHAPVPTGFWAYPLVEALTAILIPGSGRRQRVARLALDTAILILLIWPTIAEVLA